MESSSNKTAILLPNQILTTTAGTLSVLGTTFIFVTFLLYRDLRTNARKILVYISIGDFLTAIVNVSGMWTTKPNSFCKTQATINIAAIISSFFWTVYLSLYLYLVLCVQIRSQTEKRVMILFHCTAWGIPLLVAFLAVIFKVVGVTEDKTSDGWCWIRTNLKDWRLLLFWMIFAGKGWEILSYVAISFFYIKVILFLKRQVYPSAGTPFLATQAVIRTADRKFTFVPIVFILLRIWGTVRFFLYAVCLPDCQHRTGTHPKAETWLPILHGIGDSSQGFANFIIFCIFTEKIRTKLKFWCSKVCPRCVGPSQPNHVSTYRVGYESTNILTDQSYEQSS